jgi:hypothetical protein
MLGEAAGKPNFEQANAPRSKARIFSSPRSEVEISETSAPAAQIRLPATTISALGAMPRT